MELLKPPQRPRSAVNATRRCVSSAPVPAKSFGAPFIREVSYPEGQEHFTMRFPGQGDMYRAQFLEDPYAFAPSR